MTPSGPRLGVRIGATAVYTALLLVTACARSRQSMAPGAVDAGSQETHERPASAADLVHAGKPNANDAAVSTAEFLRAVDEEFDALIRRVSIGQPPGDMPDGSVLLLDSTVVEADTIKVNSLHAITVEANEIRGRDVKTVRSGYPTKAEPHLSMLYGQLVEGEILETHHVRARLIIVDSLRAHTIRKLRKPLDLLDRDGAVPERNGCRSIAQGVDYASCGQWIYRSPRPINPASFSPGDTGTPRSGTD